jgi:hypothetical protein
MNSIKTKSSNYSLRNSKAIAGVVLVPKEGHFVGYVAWEWEDQAQKKIFAITESAYLVGNFDYEWINNIADYGNDVTHKKEVQKLFPHLF